MDTRMRILKESGMLFSKMGIRAVSMDYIAQELGVSKRTIYEIFIDKNDLLEQAIVEGVNLHKTYMMDKINTSDNVIIAIVYFMESHRNLFRKINPLFFNDLKKYHAKVFSKLNKNGELRDFTISKHLIQKGINDGTFLSVLNINLTNMFFHEVLNFCQPTGLASESFSMEQIRDSIFLPYLRGIATKEGLAIIESTEFFKQTDYEN